MSSQTNAFSECSKLIKLTAFLFYGKIHAVAVDVLLRHQRDTGLKDTEISSKCKLGTMQIREILAQLRADGIISGDTKKERLGTKKHKIFYYRIDCQHFTTALAYRLLQIQKTLDIGDDDSIKYQCVNEKCDFRDKTVELLDVISHCTNRLTGDFECELCKHILKSTTEVKPTSGSLRELLARFNNTIMPISRLLRNVKELMQKERLMDENKHKEDEKRKNNMKESDTIEDKYAYQAHSTTYTDLSDKRISSIVSLN